MIGSEPVNEAQHLKRGGIKKKTPMRANVLYVYSSSLQRSE